MFPVKGKGKNCLNHLKLGTRPRKTFPLETKHRKRERTEEN